MLMRESKKRVKLVVKKPTEELPPIFQPNPVSSQSVLRCTRVTCRSALPANSRQCNVCGCMILTTAPLDRYTMYVEDF